MVYICDCLVAQSIVIMHKITFTQAPVPAALTPITNDSVATIVHGNSKLTCTISTYLQVSILFKTDLKPLL